MHAQHRPPSHSSPARDQERISNGERVQPPAALLRARLRLLHRRRRRPRRLHHPLLHPHLRLLQFLSPLHALRHRLLPRHPTLLQLPAPPPPPHLDPLPSRSHPLLRPLRLRPRAPPAQAQGHPLRPVGLRRRPSSARPVLGPHRRALRPRGLPGAALRVLLRRRRQRRGCARRGRPGHRVRQGQVRGSDPQGPRPAARAQGVRLGVRPGGNAHRARPLRGGRAGARGQRRLRDELWRRGGSVGQHRRQAGRAGAAAAVELQGQPDCVRRRRARRRHVGPARVVVPGAAGLRRGAAPGTQRAREPAMAGGGGRRSGLLPRRASLQEPALMVLIDAAVTVIQVTLAPFCTGTVCLYHVMQSIRQCLHNYLHCTIKSLA